MSLEKVRDISVIVGLIGIFVGTIVVTFTYLAPIKENTESISTISTAVAHIEERTKDISLIKDTVIALRAETKAYITPQKGGELVSRDWRITVTVHPGSIPEPASLNYTTVVDLPVKLPEGIQPAGYNFALAPYTLAGL